MAETDHKCLGIIMRNPLQSTPLTVQRMRIRLQRYNVTVKYQPGKEIHVADTLSRSGAREEDLSEDLDLESYVEGIMKEMSVSDDKLKEIFVTLRRMMLKYKNFDTASSKDGQRPSKKQFRVTGTVEMK